MQWFLNLFIRQDIRDFVQNYEDCPANWQSCKSTYRFVNERHGIKIEFYSRYTDVYSFYGTFNIPDKDELRLLERRYLCREFRRIAHPIQAIPTKATYPEEFI